jgi:hypothetical protein
MQNLSQNLKRQHGRSRHRWEDSIRMHLHKIGWEGVDWMHLAQDRGQWWSLMNMVKTFRLCKRQGIS